MGQAPPDFEHYDEIYPGITGDSIRASIDPIDPHITDLGTLAGELRGDERAILESTEGDMLRQISNAPYVTGEAYTRLAQKGQWAAGCTRQFAADVDAFDTTVTTLNETYRSRCSALHGDPDVRSGDLDYGDEAARIKRELQPQYVTATTTLDDAADAIALKLAKPPTDEQIREFVRLGYIPLAAASYWSTLYLSDDDKRAAYNAEVETNIDRMRDEGLLGPGDPGARYREWLYNAAEGGVSFPTLLDIARDHDITPQSFEVLDGLEEVTDPDGKKYFILPTDISGDDARQAVVMTYILNAGTDYGDAPGSDDNNFTETPYSSEEVQRIIDRQNRNDWTYDDDVAFVHGNGGRLSTTPNGMLMGLGGNLLQDQFSQAGGSTWGDTFMLNIDDPDDAREALRTTIESGSSNQVDDDGNQYSTNLDLDRLLHHEERHSQQWADEGYTGFLWGYGNESVDVDWKGWGPFQAPIPHQVEGKDNSYEVDAGLSDGGYSE